MILNPWPCLWTPPTKTPESVRGNHSRLRGWCEFSRYPMMCSTAKFAPPGEPRKGKRATCSECYIYQQSIDDKRNKALPDDEKVIHICDVCGREIGRIDHIIYLTPTNRDGVALMNKELCFHCAWQLLNWAGGINDILPDAPDEDVKFIWREEEEIDLTKLKPHKRKKRSPHTKLPYGRYANGDRYSYAKKVTPYRFSHRNKKDEKPQP